MLLVTGEARFADLLERTLYNGVLAGLALDGSRLLLRQSAARARRPSRPGRARRASPAVVRVRLLPAERDAAAGARCGTTSRRATTTAFRSTSTRRATLGPVRVRTDYPWDGRVDIEVAETGRSMDAQPARPRLESRARLDGEPVAPAATRRSTRDWSAGDTVTLELDMTPRVVPRIRASTPCAAAWRSSADRSSTASRARTRPRGARVDDLRLDPAASCAPVERPDLLGGIVASRPRRARPAEDGGWPYGARRGDGGAPVAPAGRPVRLVGQPRRRRMRVWMPVLSG